MKDHQIQIKCDTFLVYSSGVLLKSERKTGPVFGYPLVFALADWGIDKRRGTLATNCFDLPAGFLIIYVPLSTSSCKNVHVNVRKQLGLIWDVRIHDVSW